MAQLIPEEPTTKETIVLTGTVYDFTTSAHGGGLEVAACLNPLAGGDNNNPIILKTSTVNKSGEYYITLERGDIDKETDPDAPFQLTFLVFQLGHQLKMDEIPTIEFENFINKQILTDLKVYTLLVFNIFGTVNRRNDVPAAHCCVELFDLNNNNTYTTLTDNEGNYQVGFLGQEGNLSRNISNKILLKFYNSEHIMDEDTEIINDLTISDSNQSYSASPYDNSSFPLTRVKNGLNSQPFLNDIIIEDDGNNVFYYYAVTNVTENQNDQWDTDQELIYIKDESNQLIKKYWRIADSAIVLDKKVEYHDSGKKKITHVKSTNLPGDTGGGSSDLPITGKVLLRKNLINYNGLIDDTKELTFDPSDLKYTKIIEHYKPSSSPTIFTRKLEEEVNFKFTKNTLDLYTWLISRESEHKEEIEEPAVL